MRIVEAFIACCLILMGHLFLSSTTATMTRAKTAELQTLVQNLLNTLGDRDVLINIVEGQEGAASSLRQLVESLVPPDMLFNVTLTSLVSESVLATATNMYYAQNTTFAETVSIQGMNTVTIPILTRKGVLLDVLLLIDGSQTMGHRIMGDDQDKLQYAKDANCVFIDLCDNSTDRLGVIPFATTTHTVQGLTSDFEWLKFKLSNLAPSGQTDIAQGLSLANKEFALHARTDATRCIIMVTDGKSAWEPAILEAGYARGNGTRLYTIGIGSSVDEKLLTEIGSEGYFYAPSGRDLEFIYRVIARELTQYVSTDIVLITITLMKT